MTNGASGSSDLNLSNAKNMGTMSLSCSINTPYL
jgi:hypothetical protein